MGLPRLGGQVKVVVEHAYLERFHRTLLGEHLSVKGQTTCQVFRKGIQKPCTRKASATTGGEDGSLKR